MTKFGDAPIVREGGIPDPDLYTWQCDLDKCEECRELRANWKAEFDAEQKQLRGKT